ncbi:MAG: response regulator [Sulfurovum sp.]|nr:response regulator [Sulfurovum sp.]
MSIGLNKNMNVLDSPSHLISILTSSMDKISKTDDNNTIIKIITTMLMEFSDSDTVDIYSFDQAKQALSCKSCDQTLSMIDPKGIIGQAFLSKKSFYCNHVVSEKHYEASIDNPDNLKIKSLMVVPIVDHDSLMGMICIYKSIRNNKPYREKDLDLISSINTFMVKIIQILTLGKNMNRVINISNVSKHLSEIEQDNEQVDKDHIALQLANTVHDIRTPANSLYGFLELIGENLEDGRLKGFIDNAKESAKLINALTDSILDQAKGSYTNKGIKLSKIHSIKFFSQVANSFSANMYDKKIDYLVSIDPSIPKEIKTDSLKLERILTNLIGNAYKFTPKGKEIYFKVKYNKDDSSLKISIADQGIGIEPNRQKDIFEAFEQAEGDTADKYGGSGLGLSISATYIKELGGKLKLKSEIDKGSKFYFSLPIEVANDEPAFESFKDIDKYITIQTDNASCKNIAIIKEYLTKLGMPEEKIIISKDLDDKTTHLICYQHKFSLDTLMTIQKRGIKFLILEEVLFSLIKDSNASKFNIASLNTYYGDLIHSTIFSGKKKRVLLADDDKINISLLRSILETEHVELFSARDGAEALDMLKSALVNDTPFDIIYIDEYMPSMVGSDVIRGYRAYEKSNGASPVFAISITGDPKLNDDEKILYDLFIKKPFNTEAVRKATKVNMV